jgi:hypothetical protein
MTTPSEVEGDHVSHIADARHKLTALIKENLYGGGSKPEGRAALIARNRLDNDLVFKAPPHVLVKGTLDDLRPFKRAIILETYGELLNILDDYARRFGSGGKAVKQGMTAIVSDPDVLGGFDSDRQAEIRAIAAGWPAIKPLTQSTGVDNDLHVAAVRREWQAGDTRVLKHDQARGSRR